MYTDDEQIAVGDHMIASMMTGHQFKPGKVLAAAGFDVDDKNAMYLYKAREEMIWPYDDRGRLIGEDVWEVDPARPRSSRSPRPTSSPPRRPPRSSTP